MFGVEPLLGTRLLLWWHPALAECVQPWEVTTGGLPQQHGSSAAERNRKHRQNNQVAEEGGENECRHVDCTSEVKMLLLLLEVSSFLKCLSNSSPSLAHWILTV